MKRTLASSRQLSVLAIELHEELAQTGLFARIESKKTGVCSCALEITCSLADTSTSQTKVIQALIDALIPSVSGEETDSPKISTTPEKVELQFSTLIEDDRATGRIEVVGFK